MTLPRQAGIATTVSPGLPCNRLLAALPADVMERLQPDLRTILFARKEWFYKAGEPVKDVYFPNGGVVSMTTPLANGSLVEVATVGDEGMVGVEAFLRNAPTAYGDTMLQVGNITAQTMGVAALRREIHQHGALENLLGRYAHFIGVQMMQSAACNAMHDVQERCCRWLLQTHDRMHCDEFVLSHEFLAMMLGTRRQSVTVVAGLLQAAGMIQYKHGHMTILDRPAIEASSCECYQVIKTHSDLVLRA